MTSGEEGESCHKHVGRAVIQRRTVVPERRRDICAPLILDFSGGKAAVKGGHDVKWDGKNFMKSRQRLCEVPAKRVVKSGEEGGKEH